MADVFAARQEGEAGFAKLVALKCMHAHLARDERFVTMFLDEARLAASIRSPHVVPVLDLGRTPDNVPYLVMDLVVGVSLAELLADSRRADQPVPMPIAVEMLAQAAQGLNDAHEARLPSGEGLGIVHRDVSPQNILVGADGLTRLSDFGIARALYRDTQTRTGELKGKFAYFSPEQARGDELDARSDIYALSIVAWEAFAGRRLFQHRDAVGTLELVKNGDIPSLADLRPDLPEPLVHAIERGLARDPSARHASGQEMSLALRTAGRGLGELTRKQDVASFVRGMSGDRIAGLESRLKVALSSDAIALPDSFERTALDPDPRGPRESPRLSTPAPTVPSRRDGRWKWWAIAAAVVLVAPPLAGAAIFFASDRSEANVSPVGSDAPDRQPAIAARACREWARALASGQKPDGSFGIERHREGQGWTTGQDLVGLMRSHAACDRPGDAPIRLGYEALATFEIEDGVTGGRTRAETPATAWAALAYAAGARELDDSTLRTRALRARDLLIRGQTEDGGFRFLPLEEGAPSNSYSTVLSVWALADTEPLGPSEAATDARRRATGWIRRALVEDVDEPPLRSVAGLFEQAAWVLLQARDRAEDREPSDDALFVAVARNMIERCALANARCTRPIYEDGRTYLERVPGQGPEFLALWHPWTTLAAARLAADDSLDLPDELRADLRVIAAWGLGEIENGIAVLTAAPDYKLAEYLFVASELASE
jgi:serine/threonine protein kinase